MSGLSRSAIAAKQLAHNAINGVDDLEMVKEIAAMITEADDLIESFIGKNALESDITKIDKALNPKINFDWKEIKLLFLPHQLEDLQEFIETADLKVDFIGVGSTAQFNEFIDSLIKYQELANIKNIGAAIHKLIEVANGENDSREEGTNWVPSSTIVGNGAIPKLKSEEILGAIDEVKKAYGIEGKLECIEKMAEISKTYIREQNGKKEK